ncbi:MAG: hypothetical protein IPQ07_39935 [Myxococcales bacterium]|nr:hypothetical protein [Myxococcales bacterium]
MRHILGELRLEIIAEPAEAGTTEVVCSVIDMLGADQVLLEVTCPAEASGRLYVEGSDDGETFGLLEGAEVLGGGATTLCLELVRPSTRYLRPTIERGESFATETAKA